MLLRVSAFYIPSSPLTCRRFYGRDGVQRRSMLIGTFVKRRFNSHPLASSPNPRSPRSYRNGTRVIVSLLIALPFCRLFANCSNNLHWCISCTRNGVDTVLPSPSSLPSPGSFSLRLLLLASVLVGLVSLNWEIRAE